LTEVTDETDGGVGRIMSMAVAAIAMAGIADAFDRYAVYNTLFLRLALGVVMVVHGADKVGGVAGFAGFLDSMGIPVAIVFAWIVTVVELVGGLLILAGVFTRYVALLFAVDMAVATVLVHLPNGFSASDGGYELTLVLFLVAIALALQGAGPLSLEREVRGGEF
jgi:putative oxidoreductase